MKIDGSWSPRIMEQILKLISEDDSIFGDDVVFSNQQGSKVDVYFKSATFSMRIDHDRIKDVSSLPLADFIPVIISITNHGQEMLEWKGHLPCNGDRLCIGPIGINTSFTA